ncbi:MAG: homocysteine S-methyltransferase family protein [Phycisphaerae bacterium]
MKASDLLQSGKVIIGDGGLGTCLQQLSQTPVELPETFCLDPGGRELIKQAHQSYLNAGAQILETNTFAANPWRLAHSGLAEQCELINETAVRLARSVAGDKALVAGSVGPLDLGLAVRDFSEYQLREYYHHQMLTLAAGGVDALFLETFSSVDEARGALSEAHETGLPIFFSMGGLALCQPYARRTVLNLIELAGEFQVDAIGINCVTPYDLSQLLPVLAERTNLPLMAYPNAGTATVVRGLVRYELPSAVLLAEAQNWYQCGAVIFGGCCGTSPDHIKLLKDTFETRPAILRSGRFTLEPATPQKTLSVAPSVREENPLRSCLTQSRTPLVAVEIRASLSRPLHQTVEAVACIANAKPDFFDVPDNPGGHLGRDCLACAYLLQQRYNIPAIIHKSATQTNALHLHSYLLGAADLGIKGVLAVTGDPPHVGPFDRWASRINDIKSSVELLRLLQLLRNGELLNGQPLPQPVDFLAGCGYAPTTNLVSQTQWLKRKIEAGAEFVFTQPIYLREEFEQIQKATQDIRIPILPGILPLTSAKQIAYLRSGKIPGIVIPDPICEFILQYDDPESQVKAGMELAEKLIIELAEQVDGFYLVMPFHKNCFTATAELVKLVAQFKKYSN